MITPVAMASKKLDLIGRRSGRLTVVAFSHVKNGNRMWLCRCECGGEKTTASNSILKQRARSCGCIGREQIRARGLARAIDLTGRVFGRLTVTARAPTGLLRGKPHYARWHCQCSCGTTRILTSGVLLSGRQVSCGCWNNEKRYLRATHGATAKRMAGTALARAHTIWDGMRRRCLTVTDAAYPDYGGRGIKICDRWLGAFENFLADMGEPPADRSLDRIDVNGNYEPGNCRWATRVEQGRNTRRRVLSPSLVAALRYYVDECGMPMSPLARVYGLNKYTVWSALRGKTWTADLGDVSSAS